MNFKSGCLGACIVTLALLGGVIFGFMGNVDTEPTTERGYRTVADATGLFNASNDRIYTDFIPAKNYTGWTAQSVTFNGTTTANPYYIITDPGESQELTVNLGNYNSTNRVQVGTLQAPYIYNGFNIKLSTLLANNNITLAEVSNIRIDLLSEEYTTYTKATSETLTNYRFIPNNWVQANPGNIGVASADLEYEAYNWQTQTYGTYKYYDGTSYMIRGLPSEMLTDSYMVDGDNYLASTTITTANTPRISTGGVGAIKGSSAFGMNGEVPTFSPTSIWLDVNPTNGVVICYSQTNGIVSTRFTSTVNDCTLSWVDTQTTDIANGTILTQGVINSSGAYQEFGASGLVFGFNTNLGWTPTMPNKYPATSNVKITYNTSAQGAYVKIAEGFGLTGTTTTWSNGYENGALDMVFSGASALTGQYTYTLRDPEDATIGAISVTNAGLSISYNGGTPLSYGTWDSYIIRSVARDGVYFVPIMTFNNFQSYTAGEPVKIGDLNADVGSFILTGTTPRFSVENTRVWMNQYGAVMNAPNINPRELFPVDTYPVLVLALRNFTVFGSSITINGASYPMAGDIITIDDVSQPLGQISIRWENGRTYIDMADRTIDTGETTDTNVSLAGAWYFTATVQEGYNYESQKLNWDIGQWGLDSTQFIIVYEGLIIAGIIISKRARGLTFTALDWIISIFAGVGGFLII